MPSGRKKFAYNQSEGELIDRARAGDQGAFEVLYEKNRGSVFALCLRMTRNQATAEDFVQEAFKSAFKQSSLDGFKKESKFSTWIHRIAANAVNMEFRKRRIREVPMEEVLPGETDDGFVIQKSVGDDEGFNPDGRTKLDIGMRDVHAEFVPNQLFLEKLLVELKRKSPGYCQMVALHDLEGLNYKEIAAVCGRSVGNGKSQHHRGIEKLRKLAKAAGSTSC